MATTPRPKVGTTANTRVNSATAAIPTATSRLYSALGSN